MKKQLTILIFLLCTLSSFAQVYMIKSELVVYSEYNKHTQTWEEFSKPVANDCIITVDSDKSIITISNGYKDAFSIQSLVETIKGNDLSDGDPYIKHVFKAIDKEGTYLHIILTKYDSGVRVITIIYTDIRYQYQGHLIDFNIQI